METLFQRQSLLNTAPAVLSSEPERDSCFTVILRSLDKKTIEAIFYTKQINWAYENEWRVMTWRHNEIDKVFSILA